MLQTGGRTGERAIAMTRPPQHWGGWSRVSGLSSDWYWLSLARCSAQYRSEWDRRWSGGLADRCRNARNRSYWASARSNPCLPPEPETPVAGPGVRATGGAAGGSNLAGASSILERAAIRRPESELRSWESAHDRAAIRICNLGAGAPHFRRSHRPARAALPSPPADRPTSG